MSDVKPFHQNIYLQNVVTGVTPNPLEAHLEWKGFGYEAGKHPPMQGWLAAPIVGRDGTNWGLLQLSDKYEGEFTEDDEKHFINFAKLVSETLEALWNVRNLQKNAKAG